MSNVGTVDSLRKVFKSLFETPYFVECFDQIEEPLNDVRGQQCDTEPDLRSRVMPLQAGRESFTIFVKMILK